MAASDDPYLARADSSVPMDLWLAMERELCSCDALCECGWDDITDDE